MKQKVMVCANFLVSAENLDVKRFRRLDHVLILVLIVTVNKFLK